jgi:uncharacterized protein (TIGR02996 family)
MSPDNPFLQALLAQPDDDTFRLAMADWFIENGQSERADFIRVQVELAHLNNTLPAAPPSFFRDRALAAEREAALARRRELEIRQRDLLIAHEAAWVKPLAEALDCRPGEWGGWVFRRGFVEYFHLPAKVINRSGHLLARLTPVRELFLRPVSPGSVVALCRGRPWVRSVTHLYLDGMGMNDAAADALVACPYLSGLKVLRYGEKLMNDEPRKRFHARFPFAESRR